MNNKYIFLLLMIVLGGFLRLYKLADFPPSLNWDEVSHGYNAYSIMKTGFDEWGKFIPVTNFRAYGDYPLPLNLYLTIPFIFLFGLNEFTIRLPHAFLGILLIPLTYFLTYQLTKNKSVSMFSSFFVATSPWTLFTSRFVLQANLAVFLLTLGIVCFFEREKNKIFLPLSILFLGLSTFAYHSTRIIAPLILLTLFSIFRKDILKTLSQYKDTRVISILLILIFFAPIPFILSNPEARARSNVVFLVDQGAINYIEQQRLSSDKPYFVERLLYNKATYFTEKFFKNYLEYFSPNFLFLNGGTQYQFSMPNTGLLFPLLLPFFYMGILITVKKSFRDHKYVFLLAWILIAPIPASMTQEHFAVVRFMTILPVPFILSSLGIGFVIEKFRKAKLVIYVLLSFSLLLLLEKYIFNYFTTYPNDYSWAWQFGYKQIVEYAKENYLKYDKIIVTKKYGEPHEYFLFFWPWNPQKYRDDRNLIRFNQSNWWWVDSFDKFYFVNDWQIKDKESEKGFVLESKGIVDCRSTRCLLITSPGNFPSGWNKIETINFKDNKAAFEIYEN